ncbi:MAG TPA: 3-isopropylmalate dehydratase small subunit [Alphaproteobacteria bacterium]|jgi:3-isopropylmalate/(R)-2-methylmalate dehydratase small subunit|nr:3-isopropylmalate dehydratase small subunit [Rickettsiales bacterium]MCH2676885.1 3-isopropylmalate dehydratase small subunit [Alphaproteobacteria bacterium]HAE75232.1 3-isopropylmalate dehydratase small subunit [Alphaproteobacteria bacterium]|tara:strand:- start:1353 stop:1964 length:612 start_codon:yes stop_codon:yes gene_type:complete
MKKFTILDSTVIPFPMINVDTDMIIPKQFLKTIKRTGLGKSLFYDLRYDEKGKLKKDFLLNKKVYKKRQILITGENFGCGSSREHAPWALLDFGIRCIIAPSYADIFYNNCFKNGILPVKLSNKETDALLQKTTNDPSIKFKIDLKSQSIRIEKNKIIKFEIDQFRKHCLLNGLDDIALTIEKVRQIDRFERNQKKNQPWLWN